MASFDVNGLNDLMKDLDFMEKKRIAPIMLEEAAPILEKAMKKKAGAHRNTGALEESIKASKARKNGNAYSISICPTGKDKKGVRNMEKAVYLEYGTSRQEATPFISPAVRESEAAVLEKMQEVFDREVGSK